MKLREILFRMFMKGSAIVAAFLGVPFLILWAVVSRFPRKRIDIGLGPEPLINNVYHKKALEQFGYSAETFVTDVYFITDQFDIRGDMFVKLLPEFAPIKYLGSLVVHYYLACKSMMRYKCLYFYFNGGPLGVWGGRMLKSIEPYLYKMANVKIVVMPYGSDVQDMSRSSNLGFKNSMSKNYPLHRFRREMVSRQIDIWTKHADHLISGCDWVDYMYHWDTLMVSHFAIDIEKFSPDQIPVKPTNDMSPIRILHAPNHREIKGTTHFIRAVDELLAEGFNIELILAEGMSNDKIRELMTSVDIVADQLIIGWYAMFAIEGMAMGKPTLCYIRQDFEDLYVDSSLVQPGELPLVKCSPLTVKQVIKELISDREKIKELGARSRAFVIKHHSLESVGGIFDQINRSMGIFPSGSGAKSST